jgi:HPt (histidine-containing phosphotransfer) domain-containing protein
MTQLVVEKQALLATLGNDIDFLKRVIGIFLADCPAMLTEIRLAVSARDPVHLKDAAHALKGSVSYFGVKNVVDATQTLESMGKQEELTGVEEALCLLEREMSLVLLALTQIASETD